MKSFKQLNEELTLSEVDVIGDVITYLSSIKDTVYETKEEALDDVASVIAELGLGFDKEAAMDAFESGEEEYVEIPLSDIGGEDVSLSVFAGESLEDKVEGELFLKMKAEFNENDNKVTLDPEIIVYFGDDEMKSLSDIEFEMSDDEEDGEEETPEEEPLEEPEEESEKPKDKELEEAEDEEESKPEETEEPAEGEEETDAEAEGEEEPTDEEPVEEEPKSSHLKAAVEEKLKELEIEADEEKVNAAIDYLESALTDFLMPEDETETLPTNNISIEPTEEPEELDTSQIEIFEEVSSDKEIWNVVLMKPSTRLIISRILPAKSEKDLEKKIKKDYPEFIILTVDPVLFYDVEKMN